MVVKRLMWCWGWGCQTTAGLANIPVVHVRTHSETTGTTPLSSRYSSEHRFLWIWSNLLVLFQAIVRRLRRGLCGPFYYGGITNCVVDIDMSPLPSKECRCDHRLMNMG